MKINDRFTVQHDEHCWRLREHVIGKDKHGNPKPQIRTTYHSNLPQVFDYLLDMKLRDAESLSAIAQIVADVRADFRRFMERRAA